MEKKRLGKGLSALLGEYLPEEGNPGLGVQVVLVADIVPNPLQPRREFSAEQLGELEASIRENGLLQPLVVRPATDASPKRARWELVAGERRWRAIRRLGWTEVPALVKDIDDRTLLVLAIVENVQRADLSPLEEAAGYRRLIDEFGYTQREVAESVGRERPTVANLLRLLHLPASVQRLVAEGKLSMGHARAILGLGNERKMAEVARTAAKEGLSVRSVEERVRGLNNSPGAGRKDSARGAGDPHLRQLETQLQRALGTAARIRVRKGQSGMVEIPFYNSEDFERVMDLGDNSAFETLPGIVEDVTAAAQIDGLPSYVTGPGGQFADFAAAFEGIDTNLLFTTVGVIFIILLLIYRSPVFLPVLISAGMALVLAQAVVYLVAKAGILTVDGQSQGILSVLVLGASTDYALLLISRFKEELHREGSWTVSMRGALKGAFPPVVASGATVILGLLCLLLFDLNSNKSLGPVGAIGIACAVIAMMVFLPALLMLFGRYWFFPFVPRHDDVVTHERGLWGGVARLVGRRARLVWVATALVLAGAALFTTQLEADGLTTAEQFTTEVDSVKGQEVLSRHFPAGTGVPVSVIGAESESDQILDVVQGVPGIADASLRTDGPPGGSPPKVIDGKVQVEALLEVPAACP